MIYFTRIVPDIAYTHTAMSKADSDFKVFAEEMGAVEIRLQLTDSLAEKLSMLTSDDVVIYQHPTFKGYNFEYEIFRQISSHAAKIITFIHDCLAIRREEAPRNNPEIQLFNQSNVIIVHSEAMRKRLKEYGVVRPMIIQGLFGYNLPTNLFKNHQALDFRHILLTGHAMKLMFLLDYPSALPVDFYGGWPMDWGRAEAVLPSNVRYHGEVDVQDLPIAQYSGFGLSWDGWSTPDLDIVGRYTKYNCPFKVSGYLAHGLPIVIWSGSAVAQLLRDYDVAIELDHLDDLDERVNQITPERYTELVKNANAIAIKLRIGEFTKNAISQALELIGRI